jgi:hypothetical protein
MPATRGFLMSQCARLKLDYAHVRIAILLKGSGELSDVHVMGTSRVMTLRRTGICEGCAAGVNQGDRAWWDADAKVVWCLTCHTGRPAAAIVYTTPIPESTATPEHPPIPSPSLDAPLSLDRGTPGGSARAEYERRHRKRAAQLEQNWGSFAGVAKFLTDDPQTTKAWAAGADGEERLVAHLERVLGHRAVVLADRKVPGTRGNIDILAVAASGIWVIDAKNYTGKVEQRDVGGWRKTDLQLYVGGRNHTKAAGGLVWQVLAASTAVEATDIPISPVLCFTNSEWSLFAKPFQQDGVIVTWAKKLCEMIASGGPLDSAEVARVAALLARKLPAK